LEGCRVQIEHLEILTDKEFIVEVIELRALDFEAEIDRMCDFEKFLIVNADFVFFVFVEN
jgi:hypothetical protein